MTTSTIVRINLVDQVYDALKRRIVSGRLAPGTQLKTGPLSEQLGVSNSPIREALRRLENERWVETIPFRGAFVRELDAKELAELYEIREFIELAALRKAMPHPEPAGLARLKAAQKEIGQALRAGDPVAYLSADTCFHQAIVDLASNARLSEMFATLIDQGRCFILGRSPEDMARFKDGRDQHAELLDAIAEGRTRPATDLLRRHLRGSFTFIRPTEST